MWIVHVTCRAVNDWISFEKRFGSCHAALDCLTALEITASMPRASLYHKGDLIRERTS